MALLCAVPARAASLFDPSLRFRTLATEHFTIYFHQGEDRTARRLAVIAEDTWQALKRQSFGPPPPSTHVVLVDQWDLANGYATPLPRNTIVVSASWPPSSDFIGDTDDWLRLVFSHEFTHIVHLDRSLGGARAVRNLFGRISIAFPNLYLPAWQIEGLATYEESVLTGGGRLHAGDFGAIVNEAARARSLQPLDRINGGLTDWPNGSAAYAYGVSFHQYLADRFGVDRLDTLADATARRVPYLSAPAFRHVYGQSLGSLWRDYRSSMEASASVAVPDERISRLTHHGFSVSGPRFDRGSPASIVYSVRTPDGFPALNRVRLDEGAAPTQLATRYLGATTAIGRDALYFDQQELRRNVGIYSDLYAWSRTSGRVTQLTRDKRLMDPDLSPDGTTLVCVQSDAGQRNLVLVRLKPNTPSEAAEITTLITEAETQFNAPRWSPDGRSIAVERHQPGKLSDVLLVDAETRSVRVLAADEHSRIATPTWRPDGRALVVAIAAQDQPFNLFEISIDGSAVPRQLTRTTGGATWPDVSPDGHTIVFVGYTVDGLDLFTMNYPENPPASEPLNPSDARALPAGDAAIPTKPYAPLRTLAPTSWFPEVETDADQVRVGASTSGYDALGYHFYAAQATWLASSPAGALRPAAAVPDWSVSYAYDRWRPTFWVGVEASTSFFEGPATDAGTPTPGTLREHEVEAGVVFPIRHTRTSHTSSVSYIRAVDDFTLPDRTVSRDRGAARAAWATTTAHSYGYSISTEGGVTGGATVEAVRPALGADADATTVTGDVRAYLPGLAPHHVLALRFAGGRSVGDPALRRTFHLGGSAPDASVIDFDRSAISLLRGFPADTFAGSHVALLNADYRFPLARPQRGIGTWPIFLHTVHGAVFADAGHAWTHTFRADAIKTSFGAELSANIVAGYFFPLNLTLGAARGHDGSGAAADQTTVYVRVGRAF